MENKLNKLRRWQGNIDFTYFRERDLRKVKKAICRKFLLTIKKIFEEAVVENVDREKRNRFYYFINLHFKVSMNNLPLTIKQNKVRNKSYL